MHLNNIIRHLKYSELEKKTILPKITLFKGISKVNIPSGMQDQKLMDRFIALYLNGHNLIHIPGINSSFIHKLQIIKSHFAGVPDSKKIQYQTKYNNIIKHTGYIRYQDCIYSVLISSRDRQKTIILLLSEYCLCIKNGISVSKIGLIIPDVTPKIKTENLKLWDCEPYWKELIVALDKEKKRKMLYDSNLVDYKHFKSILTNFIGRNVNLNTLLRCISGKVYPSYQIFVTYGYNISLSNEWAINIKNKKQKIYIHAPFVCNLSLSYNSKVVLCLNKLLNFSEKSNIKGVVVHTGRSNSISNTVALNRMRNTLIKSTNKDLTCKLLLETPAGQRNETLDKIEDMVSFWYTLPQINRNRISICVDTCHVFAAGYSPIEYINLLVSNKIPIGLIHFNDSLYPKGKRIDRHAPFGEGYIGFKDLFEVAKWAYKNCIDCVREY